MNKTLNPMRVLMAEDDHVTALGIKAGLQGLGHTVVGHAPNGKIAIQMVQELSPEIILMDIEMPEMDGLEATQWVQANCPRPVVLLTSREEPEMVNRASQIGAGAYLVKPPRPAEMDRALAIAAARFADLVALRKLNAELKAAMEEIKTLRGLIPICSHCKKIRGDVGWTRIEDYIRAHSEAEFTHGICPDCIRKHFPEIAEEMLSKDAAARK